MSKREPKQRYQYCVVLGGGGHAAVLIESLQASGLDIVRAVLDQDQSQWGKEILEISVLGGDALLPDLKEKGADCFVVGVGTVGNSRIRRRLYEYGLSLGLEPLTVIHPTSYVSPSARLAPGCQLLPHSIVHTRAVLGNNVLINSGAIVEHDCVLGDHTHVATGAQIAGGVEIGEGTLIGIGASVRQGVRIGRESVIGAGAAVVKDVPDNVVVVGVPARVCKRSQTMS
ncbi:MAG: acetyltransferase [Thermoguttaceae bacterium]|jgi:UDP-perosamine 4-acetyltransferase